MSKVKKLFAIVLSLAMIMGMSFTTMALPANTQATITIDNAGENAKFNYVQIVVANPQTETGWDIVNDYLEEFQNTEAFGNLDEQTILKGMISAATNDQAGTAIGDFDSKYAKALDLICASISAPSADSGETSPITVTSAGVYVIRGFETGFTYGTMAGYVAFGPYDTGTGLPTDLKDETVEAKRTPTTATKSATDEDKVVEVNRDVEYTVTSTVPFIPLTNSDRTYWFTDTIDGGVYVTNNNLVEINVTAGTYNHTFTATHQGSGTNWKISVDLSEILANNAYANETITITYKATVKDVTVGNDAKLGKAENDSSFGYDDEDIYTGEIELIKYASDNTPNTTEDNTELQGAEFIVYKVVEGKNLYAQVANGKIVTWVEDKDSATHLTTGSDGRIKVEGLDVGTYYFEEVKAPEGYSLDATPVSVELKLTDKTATSIITATPAEKLNTKLSALPGTGGIGTTIFTIGGCVIMITAAGLYFASRRRQENK